ncbi:MAG: acetyl-CoA carboxylase biotin carboxyl carrier protein subunit [Candidatus Poseidoniales archaeon]
MDFKTKDGILEIEPQRNGSQFSYEGLILDLSGGLWLEIDGRKHKAHATKVGDVWWVHILGHTMCFELIEPGATGGMEEGAMTSPMPGKILEVLVKVGQEVKAGQALMIMEAMKMEHKIVANQDGVIQEIHYEQGAQVDQGAQLLSIE